MRLLLILALTFLDFSSSDDHHPFQNFCAKRSYMHCAPPKEMG